MSIRPAMLTATAFSLALAAPALAQDDRYAEVLADEAVAAAQDAAWAQADHQQARHLPAAAMTTPSGRPLAYTAEQREQWLADCRTVMRGEEYYIAHHQLEDDDDADGGLLGGLLGAVIGGVAGNRIADGDRLAGTIIGAGVGGLAGLALGSALSGDDRDTYRDEDYLAALDAWASDYCAAYLRNHENGAQYAQTVMLMAVPMQQGAMHQMPMHHQHREVVREEWVDEPVAAPARRAIAPRHHAPASDKRIPLR